MFPPQASPPEYMPPQPPGCTAYPKVPFRGPSSSDPPPPNHQHTSPVRSLKSMLLLRSSVYHYLLPEVLKSFLTFLLILFLALPAYQHSPVTFFKNMNRFTSL